MRLTEEEQSYLEDLMSHPEYWHVINKVLEEGVKAQRERVMSEDINQSSRALVLARARADGANALASFVGSLKRKAEKKNGNR